MFAFNCIVCCPYGVWNLWYHIKFWRHSESEPCELMMPFWVTVVVRGPCLLYIAGYPLWHIAMTVERAWATLRVHQYEKISSSYGTVSASVVWLLSFAYAAYWGGTYLQYACEVFAEGTFFISLTAPTNADFLLISNYALLGVDLLTSLVDIALIYSNLQRLRKYVN
ncbi:hypothetical protein AAVH_11520 [Aphelenchoides avenae]|nr:hypothetical protein AAVH_11520 [Aphelenchus avenae]